MRSALRVGSRVVVPPHAMEVSATRASGPGGQNVNKVSSKVELRVDLAQIEGMPTEARARLRALVANKLDAEGRLFLTSQKERDQPRNLEDCREKLRALIERAMVRPKARRPTKPTRGSVERRIEAKKRVGQKKADRRGGYD